MPTPAPIGPGNAPRTDPPDGRRFRAFWGLPLFVSLLVGGCSSSQVLCPCPSGGATILLPADPIASVTADKPCTITKLGDSVLVEREGVGTCQVRIQMTSGVTYTSEVRFTGGGGCCPYTNFGTAGPLEPIDAGPDGG